MLSLVMVLWRYMEKAKGCRFYKHWPLWWPNQRKQTWDFNVLCQQSPRRRYNRAQALGSWHWETLLQDQATEGCKDVATIALLSITRSVFSQSTNPRTIAYKYRKIKTMCSWFKSSCLYSRSVCAGVALGLGSGSQTGGLGTQKEGAFNKNRENTG